MLNITESPGSTEEHPDKEQVQRLFADGLAFHRQDRLEHAMAAYEQVLKLMPGHVGALHHVGIVAFQFGNYHIAAGFLRSAIGIDPALPAVHCDLGNAYKELGKNDDALHAYGCALALDANHLDAGFNRAITLHEMQRYEEALEAYAQIIACHGEDAALLNNIGMIQYSQAHHEQALASFDQALAIDARYLDAHANRCQVLEAIERFDTAMAGYTQMIEIAPHVCEGYFKRALLQMRLGRPEQAMADAEEALRVAPSNPEGHRIRGMALHAQHRFAAAVDSFNAAVKLNTADAAVYDQRGLALTAQRQFTLALASHERAIELDNNMVAAHLHRAAVLRELGRLESAAQGYSRALELDADSAEAWTGRAIVLAMLGHDDEALDAYRHALALDPDYAPAYWNRSHLYLRNGQFEQGWNDFEWRVKANNLSAQTRASAAPRWQGTESLEGKTILLYAEHNVADTLHTCRYVGLVAARGATVILEAPQELAPLLTKLKGVSQLVITGEPLPACDFECPLPSLPFVFDTTLGSIPSIPRYLASDPDKVAHWANVLGERTKPRIGIVWGAPAADAGSAQRSIRLADFGRLFGANCQFVVLQTEVNAIDRAVLGMKKNVFQPGAAVADYGDIAALCEIMDVIVTIDGAIAHLAGALGKPTWVLLPTVAADWRWLRERADNPWYPSATLYRQPHNDDWSAVLDTVLTDLREMVEK